MLRGLLVLSCVPLGAQPWKAAATGWVADELTLSVTGPPGEGTFTAAWLSPEDNERSGATVKAAVPGTVRVPLRYPKDAMGEFGLTQRIRWTVSVGGQTLEGIDSLSRLSRSLFTLDAVHPATMDSEGFAVVHARTYHPGSGRPLPDVEVTLRYKNQRVQAQTGKDGIAVLRMRPVIEGSHPHMELTANLDGISQLRQIWLSPAAEGSVVVQTDKPVYQPGDRFRFRLIARHADGRPAPGRELDVNLENAEGQDVAEVRVTTNRFGAAAGEFAIPKNAEAGEFRLEIDGDGLDGTHTFPVKPYLLPLFALSAAKNRPFYRPGEAVEIRVEAKHLDGRPGIGMLIEDSLGGRAVLDDRGSATLRHTATEGSEELKIAATDPLTGRTEKRIERWRTSREALRVRTRTMAGTHMLFVTTPDGRPAEGVPIFRNGVEAARTSRYGLAGITGTVSGQWRASTVGFDPNWSIGEPLTIQGESLVIPGEPIHATLVAQTDLPSVIVRVMANDSLYFLRWMPLHRGANKIEIPWKPEMRGLMTLTANAGSFHEAEANLYAPVPRGLAFNIRTGSASYRPGETADLLLDTDGRPASVGLAIVDQALLQRGGGFDWNSKLRTSELDAVTDAQRNDPAWQQYARWMIGARRVPRRPADVEIPSVRISREFGAFRHRVWMSLHEERERSTYDVYHPVRTRSQIEALFRRTKLLAALPADPWGRPLRYSVELSSRYAEIVLRSSGPDMTPDTLDDFEATRYQWNLYEGLERYVERNAPSDTRDLMAWLRRQRIPAAAYSDQMGQRLRVIFVPNGRHFGHRLVNSANEDVGYASFQWFKSTANRIQASLIANPRPPGNQSEWNGHLSSHRITLPRDATGAPLAVRFATDKEAASLHRRITRMDYGGARYDFDPEVHARTIEIWTTGAEPALLARFRAPILEAPATAAGRVLAGSAAVFGDVVDATGAAIANAKVELFRGNRVPAARVASTQSNESGSFTFVRIEPGVYTLQFYAPGFRTLRIDNVAAYANTLTPVEAQLDVGTVSQSVEVSGETPQVDTQTASAQAEVATENAPPPLPRTEFPEVIHWQPLLETDERGNASVSMRLPGSLTTWHVEAFASDELGRSASATTAFDTRLLYFLTLDPPVRLTEGDRIELPAQLHNLSDAAQKSKIDVKASPSLRVESPPGQALVNAGASALLPLLVTARAATKAADLSVTARGSTHSDALTRRLLVEPRGTKLFTADSTYRGGRSELRVTLPATRGELELRLRSGLESRLEAAIEALVQLPHGCGEQITSTAFSSVLYLEQFPEGRRAEGARQAIASAVQSLASRRSKGGLSYWPGGNADLVLTAYALQFAHRANARELVDSFSKFLEAARNRDGLWGRISDDTYVTYSLAVTGHRDAAKSVWPQVAKAVGSDANSNDIVLATLTAQILGDEKFASKGLARIAQLAEQSGADTYWPAGERSYFGYSVSRLSMDTTARAAAALFASPDPAHRELTSRAHGALLRARDSQGIWRTSQTTVLAMDTLLRHTPRAAAEDIAVRVTANGTAMEPVKLSAADSRTLSLTHLANGGENVIVIESGSSAPLDSQLVGEYSAPWPQAPQPARLGALRLTVESRLGKETVSRNEAVEVATSVRCEGGCNGNMLLVDIPLPPGARVDESSIDLSRARHEAYPDRVTFYLWAQTAVQEIKFRMLPALRMIATVPPATARFYYAPETVAIAAPGMLTVE